MNLQDNTEEAALQGHTSDVYSVAITSDNKYILLLVGVIGCKNMESQR